MKKYLKVALCVILPVSAMIIVTAIAFGSNNKKMAYEEEQTQMVEIEKWEAELLSGLYSTEVEQKRLRSGELYEYQKDMLDQLRKVKEYLDTKYPDYETAMTGIIFKTLKYGYSKFTFSVDGFDGQYTVLINNDIPADDFFVELIRPGYDDAVKSILREEGINAVCVKTKFTDPFGSQVDIALSQAELLGMKEELPRTTKIYVNSMNKEKTIKRIRTLFTEEYNIYGYYMVYCSEIFVENMSCDEYEQISMNAGEQITVDSFSCGY